MAVVMCSRARCRFRGFCYVRDAKIDPHIGAYEACAGLFAVCEFRKYLILLGVVLCNKIKGLGAKKNSHIGAHGVCASFFSNDFNSLQTRTCSILKVAYASFITMRNYLENKFAHCALLKERGARCARPLSSGVLGRDEDLIKTTYERAKL
jgi:hypothetical protein